MILVQESLLLTKMEDEADVGASPIWKNVFFVLLAAVLNLS